MGSKPTRKRKPIVQSTPAKGTETQEVKTEVVVQKRGKPQYWKNPTFLNGQVIRGLVTDEDRAAYIECVRLAMPAEEFEGWEFETKVSDRDLDAERKAEAIAKQKKNLGLT